MIKYSNILTVKCLKKICKIYKIKNEKYSKSFLLDLLNKYSAAKVIQQKFRKKIDFNKVCPISHEEIRYPWICVKNNTKYIYYDFDTFVIYLKIKSIECISLVLKYEFIFHMKSCIYLPNFEN